MLQFFRRYQKIFFIVVTFVVVVSFCFFGTYGTSFSEELNTDQELGKGMAGDPIKSREFTTLCRLLESSVFDHSSDREPNLLNPGVIEREFLSTGLGLLLVKPYFSEMKKDLDQRVKKIHHFRPYVHPTSSEVSAEWVWSIFSPSFKKRYELLQSRSDQATAETFALMSQLYVDHLSFPPTQTLKQILTLQQNQARVQPDPLLEQADLSLFGFTSLEDWFGPRFVPLVAGFILNVSQLAEDLGYQVKTEEVRSNLLQNIYQGYQLVTRKEKINPEEVTQYYTFKIRSMGLDENGLLSVWKRVMLFNKLFEDTAKKVQIDSLAYQQFDEFAKESVDVDLYQLPLELQFSDFLSMLRFQLYIEGISQEGIALRKTGSLPRKMASIEQVEKRSPEFVQQLAEIQWRCVTKEELESSISLKATCEWELQESNWSTLKKIAPSLAGAQAGDISLRIALLNQLKPEERAKVDAFARSQMIATEPKRLALALQSAPLKVSSLGLRPGADFKSVLGIEENAEILSLLKTASLQGEEVNSSAQRLAHYTPDQKHFYSIEVVSRQKEKQIITLREATQDGTLDRLLHQVLEKAYPEVRKKNPALFQTASGDWKPLEGQVKELVGKYVFSDLLKAIEEGYCAKGGSWPSDTTLLSFYSDVCFFPLMEEAKQRLKGSVDAPSASLVADPLANQWHLEKQSKQLTRANQAFFSTEELFSLQPNQWSSVQVGKQGALCFCFVKQKTLASDLGAEHVEKGQQILSLDVRKDLMGQLLQKIHTEKGLNLLSYASEEIR